MRTAGRAISSETYTTEEDLELLALFRSLIERSGYYDGIVKAVRRPSTILYDVSYDGLPVGVYNRRTDCLLLSGGSGLKVKNPIVAEPKIEFFDGKWRIAIETLNRMWALNGIFMNG